MQYAQLIANRTQDSRGWISLTPGVMKGGPGVFFETIRCQRGGLMEKGEKGGSDLLFHWLWCATVLYLVISRFPHPRRCSSSTASAINQDWTGHFPRFFRDTRDAWSGIYKDVLLVSLLSPSSSWSYGGQHRNCHQQAPSSTLSVDQSQHHDERHWYSCLPTMNANNSWMPQRLQRLLQPSWLVDHRRSTSNSPATPTAQHPDTSGPEHQAARMIARRPVGAP